MLSKSSKTPFVDAKYRQRPREKASADKGYDMDVVANVMSEQRDDLGEKSPFLTLCGITRLLVKATSPTGRGRSRCWRHLPAATVLGLTIALRYQRRIIVVSEMVRRLSILEKVRADGHGLSAHLAAYGCQISRVARLVQEESTSPAPAGGKAATHSRSAKPSMRDLLAGRFPGMNMSSAPTPALAHSPSNPSFGKRRNMQRRQG